MFTDGVTHQGNCGAQEYLFHFTETYESGAFYYLWLMAPILEKIVDQDGMSLIRTYRTALYKKGNFTLTQNRDGIDYEVIMVHKKDKFVICNNDNIEEKFEEFLSMFVEDSLYIHIPEINTLMGMHPNLLI